jgi:hypothetical protein
MQLYNWKGDVLQKMVNPSIQIDLNTRDALLDNLEKILNNSIDKKIARNRIIYGAPGTGKSSLLKEDVEKYFFSNPKLYKRVTFHQAYSYGQFMGAYKPVPIYKKMPEDQEYYKADKKQMIKGSLEPIIEYKLIPGPFLEMLCKAFENPFSNFLILIEEINRAEPASVFGDIFQLLDRNEYGESEYSVTFSNEIMSYLREVGILGHQIKLPSNLYIWATMNSSDQGVTPMDAAFKRRWSFEYLHLDDNENKVKNWDLKLYFDKKKRKIKWNVFRKKINKFLKEKYHIAEDRLLGPFFLKKEELEDDNLFINKLLLYLVEDVLRHNDLRELFVKDTFSDIVKVFRDKENVFQETIISKTLLLDEETEGTVETKELEDQDQPKNIETDAEGSTD